MRKGTRQALMILSLIPIMYLLGVLFHAFVTWQVPCWSPALWDEFTRGVYLILTVALLVYAYLFYEVGNRGSTGRTT